MMMGFCLIEQRNVPINDQRKCLTDGSYALAPSTACSHRRWIDGAWSECTRVTEAGTHRPCKAVAPGTWRSILSQQVRAERKREADRRKLAGAAGAPRRVWTDGPVLSPFPQAEKAPKLKTAHKGAKDSERARCPRQQEERPQARRVTCERCRREFRPPSSRVQRFCSMDCRRLPTRACAVCALPFRPMRARRLYCSRECATTARLEHPNRQRAPLVPCRSCGVPIKRLATQQGKVRLYCSRNCYADALRTTPRVPCPRCSTPFRAKRMGGERRQKYCSAACAHAARKEMAA